MTELCCLFYLGLKFYCLQDPFWCCHQGRTLNWKQTHMEKRITSKLYCCVTAHFLTNQNPCLWCYVQRKPSPGNSGRMAPSEVSREQRWEFPSLSEQKWAAAKGCVSNKTGGVFHYTQLFHDCGSITNQESSFSLFTVTINYSFKFATLIAHCKVWWVIIKDLHPRQTVESWTLISQQAPTMI